MSPNYDQIGVQQLSWSGWLPKMGLYGSQKEARKMIHQWRWQGRWGGNTNATTMTTRYLIQISKEKLDLQKARSSLKCPIFKQVGCNAWDAKRAEPRTTPITGLDYKCPNVAILCFKIWLMLWLDTRYWLDIFYIYICMMIRSCFTWYHLINFINYWSNRISCMIDKSNMSNWFMFLLCISRRMHDVEILMLTHCSKEYQFCKI